ncbi:DUF4912 domain-containing protein [Desulfotomaculum sp. 1211_IL3151]|uniref:DUF4912 domain-containing protein n=1 Tax=Desulfotomaculum sp. 1211_IL3151 TaxID=3084055 RepID=UPI002FDAB895
MDNFWISFPVLLALAALVFFLLPRFDKTADVLKKPELPQRNREEEFAQEISPIKSAESVSHIEEDPFIPHYYGVNRLVAVAKDPNWLYSYWEVSNGKIKEFIHLYGEEAWQTSKQVLRVYDITGTTKDDPCSWQEISPDPFADNWFVEVGQPEHSFFLELGRILADGRYIKLLTSNTVSTPRASISERTDEQWVGIDELYNKRIFYGFSSTMLTDMGIESPECSSKKHNNS